MTVLTVTAGLLLMLTFSINGLLDGFSVCYNGSCKVNFCTESVLELCKNNVKMLFAKTVYNKLLCFSVVFESYCSVFFNKL